MVLRPTDSGASVCFEACVNPAPLSGGPAPSGTVRASRAGTGTAASCPHLFMKRPLMPLTAFSVLSLEGCGRGGGHKHVGDCEGGEVLEPLAEVNGRAWQVGADGA